MPSNGTVGAVVERPTAALRIAGSIPTQNKYLYGLQVVVPDLTTHDTGVIPSVW